MLRDLKHAVRVLLKSKGWAAIVLVSLALGIGANTALFSAINGLMLQSIAAREPDTIVRLSWYGDNDMVTSSREYGYGGEVGGERRRATFSISAYQAFVESNDTLDDLFACSPFGQVNVVVDGEAEIASAFIATGNYFQLLGLSAVAGRTLTPADDDPGQPAAAMISHGYWKRRFAGDPDAVGRVVAINSVPVTIVGVTTAEYAGVQAPGRRAADIHFPMSLGPQVDDAEPFEQPTFWSFQIMGRLKPGATPAQVQGNLEGVFQATARSGLDSYLAGLSAEARQRSTNQDRSAVPRLLVQPGGRGVYDTNPNTQRDARILGGVVLLVLLIVCANVANLLLSRATSRRQEIAIRLSLGATRGRLVRQLVTESVFLSLLGGLLGLMVAYWARGLLPFGQNAALNWRVFAFAGLLSIGAGVVFGIVPALRATGFNLSASLKDNSRGIAGSRSWTSRGLLVVQVAVSLVLLIGAGLFLGTLRNLRSVDVGFDPENVLLFWVNPSLSGYDSESMPALYDQMQERLEGLPGVQSASLSRVAFLTGSTSTSDVYLEGGAEEGSVMYINTVSPEFFETLKIPMLAGRGFGDQDHAESPPVAIVSAAAAKEIAGREAPTGRRFGFALEDRSDIEIIGVASDVKYNDLRADAPPTVFLLHTQQGYSGMVFELRTTTDPLALVPAVRTAVRSIEPNMPVQGVSTQSEEIANRFRQERYFAMAYSWFGGLATLLAAIGLFGLASYSVATRTNEIGIRMALGAQRLDVIRMILRESLVLVVLGVALGLATAVAAGRTVSSLLFGIQPVDLSTMSVAALVVVLVSVVAVYVPARRAARVDPMVALQYE